MIRLLTDLGTDAPSGRPYAYHVLYDIIPQGLPVRGDRRQVAQGAVSTGFAEGKSAPAAQRAKKQTRSQGDCGSAFYDRTESLFLRPCAQAFHLRTCRTVVVTVSLRTYLPVQQPVYSHQFHQWHPRSEHREQELHQPSSTSEEQHCAQWERGHHP